MKTWLGMISRGTPVLMIALSVFALAAPRADGQWRQVDEVADSAIGRPFYKRVRAADPDHIMGIGFYPTMMSFVRSSTDGGRSWSTALRDSTVIPSTSGAPANFARVLLDIACPTPGLAIVGGDSGTIWRTTNWGRSWQEQQMPGPHHPIVNISMCDSLNGLAYQPRNMLLHTIDGGIHWASTPIDSSILPVGYVASKVFAITPGTWLIAATSTTGTMKFIRTADAGRTWKPVETNRLVTVQMIDPVHGWSAGYGPQLDSSNSQIRNDVVQVTTDGGNSWRTLLDTFCLPAFGLYDIAFSDMWNGIAIGGLKALRTTNGGATWSSIVDDLDFDAIGSLHGIACPAPEVAFAGTEDGHILRYDARSSGVAAPAQPTGIAALHAIPNPMCGEGIVQFDLPESSRFHIDLVDALGRKVMEIAEGTMPAGVHAVPFRYHDLPAGMYYACLRLEARTCATPVIVEKP
ncbi:MAG TPA: hypothetical protein VHI13_03000 [Candidatus Kapabacteria bacterium]|nr:hypothetical protein [Candidatus Kapabacteria bacterium]